VTAPVERREISFIGLGKVGAPMAATFALKGHRVIGVDENPRTVSLVNEGRAPVFEPGLEAALLAARERLVATDDYETAMSGSEITFIVMPTPSDEAGGLTLQDVLRACGEIGDALHKKEEYHLTVLTSTVLPGSTDGMVKPLLEARAKSDPVSLDTGLAIIMGPRRPGHGNERTETDTAPR
jgi:UDPglucose 6-dehydrogenase